MMYKAETCAATFLMIRPEVNKENNTGNEILEKNWKSCAGQQHAYTLEHYITAKHMLCRSKKINQTNG